MKNILITGAAGFIGSNFVNRICPHEAYYFHLIDSFTYAGDLQNISSTIASCKNLSFEKIDIKKNNEVKGLFEKTNYAGIINFAAETHVDNSLKNPQLFFETNVIGTLNLLHYSKDARFLQISTDEVYGQTKDLRFTFSEKSPLNPRNPYSISKAAADRLVMSSGKPFIITRSCNNYGEFQNPEKLIPKIINNALKNISLPIYGNGLNFREWIHVHDNVDAIWKIFREGKTGNIYNIGSGVTKRNIDLAEMILTLTERPLELIEYVKDRPGHDFGYALDCTKLKNELGHLPAINFRSGLTQLVNHHIN